MKSRQSELDPGVRMVPVGTVAGLYGVRGWVKVVSHTDPRENLLGYSPWYLGGPEVWETRRLVAGRVHGKGLVAQIEGCEDRDQAAALLGQTIAVRHDQLPGLPNGEFYWSDLEGLKVETLDGTLLGTVDHLFETGANDVLVVVGERERLLPYVWDQVIRGVDLDAGIMRVDWDPDF